MDYEAAASYWTEADQDAVKVDREQLKEKIDEFINRHNTCALAVADGDFVRCTPIEYMYFNDSFWMFSEGGLKFKALKNNKHVCLAICEEYTGFGNIHGMQVTGLAEMIEPWSEDYYRCLQKKNIPAEAFRKLSHPMNLIRVKPQIIDFLNSEFKAGGASPRQQYIFEKQVSETK